MTADRVCSLRGLLVDGDTRLLTDPCEYFDEGVWVQVGCGRLKCSNCNSWVRGGPPGLSLKEGVRCDLRALHAAPDWSVLPFLEEPYALHNRVRLYTCGCRYWEANTVDPIENDHELDSDPNVPWSCSGHPLPQFPITLADLTIDASSDASELVTKLLNGACPRALNRKDALGPEPAVWLAWLYVYLRGLPLAEKLSSAIADRLEDTAPQIVGRVLWFFAQFPGATGVEKLVAYAESHVHSVALGYPIPEFHSAPTLWAVLIARLSQRLKERDALDARVEALVKRLFVVPISSLRHDDVGPTSTVEFERQRRSPKGWEAETLTWFLEDFARGRQRERADVVAYELSRLSDAFNDPEMRVFIADHIAEIDAAAPGRWRAAMTLLTDWLHKPAQGHLVVVAGARVIQDRLASPEEFRSWIQDRRSHGWVDDAWVVPLQSMLDEN
jgi:hypothetical protein